jgi:hypothetical protein
LILHRSCADPARILASDMHLVNVGGDRIHAEETSSSGTPLLLASRRKELILTPVDRLAAFSLALILP